MPATETHTTTPDGLISVSRYSYSSCGNYDDGCGWVECPNCKAVLFHSEDGSDWELGEIEDVTAYHVNRMCMRPVLGPHEVDLLAPLEDDEPF